MTSSTQTGAQPQGTLWMLELDRLLPVGPAPHVPAVFMRAGPEVAGELAQAMDLDDPSVVLQRFANGRHCYIARIEGTGQAQGPHIPASLPLAPTYLVTYGWVTFDEECIGELGMSFHLQAGEAYIWNCATLPSYRGLRLYPALLVYILRELQSQGLHRVWIGADTDNLASQIGMALAGFEPIGDLFIKHDSSTQRACVRGRPGVPEELVTDVRQALYPPC
jgi:ribosomal protein S18 acetylase RimI-like enzyme